MLEALDGHESTIKIGGRSISNLRFADDIDLIAGSENELQDLTTRLEKASQKLGMEISAEKSKILVTSTSDNPTTAIVLNGEVLEEVQSFKYLGAIIAKDGCSDTEIKARLGAATAAMSRLKTIWKSNNIHLTTKMKLYKTLVLSILLYGCESWTLTAEMQRKLQAFENKSYRRMLNVTYLDRITNSAINEQIVANCGPQEPLITTIKTRILKWFGRTCQNEGLSKNILQGSIQGKQMTSKVNKHPR